MRWMAIITLALLLAACKPAAEPVVIQGTQVPVERNATLPAQNITPQAAPFEEVVYKPGTETQPAIGQPPVENETAEEEVYERPVEAPPSIAKFQIIFKKEVKEYKFVYKSDQWFVQGKRAKMIPFRLLENMYQAPFIDAIYIDLENKTAIGVCEGHDANVKRQCAQVGAIGKKFSLPYVQFRIPLPEDWLIEYQNIYMTAADSPKLATDREVVHLKHQSQTRTIDIYIDPSFGLPVAVIDGGVEYHYEKLSRNSLGYRERMVPEAL